DNVITQKDLQEYLSLIYMNLTASKRNPKEIEDIMSYYKANGLERLIEEKLKIDHAEKIELKIRPEAVEKRIQEIKEKYPSETEFTNELIAQGMTLTDLKKKILDQYKAYYVEEIEVKQKTFVSPQQVNEYYQQNLGKAHKTEGVLMDSLFFPYEDNQMLTRQNAHEALAIIKNPLKLARYPKGFEDVAKKFSGTFAASTIRKGEALPEIENVIFKLNAGEISPLVPSKEGIYIFKIKEKIPESTESFANVKDEIYDFLFQKQLNDRREEWLKRLKEKSFIEIKKQ
ncbi:MAG: peptidylprolyl isomerase, partial [Candidatus Omnitrophica bacterium]|nr:peptidylprolyl isomerase [Candidatus Omnitrophota bacterium]